TRDPKMEIQMLGVAGAPLNSDFSRPQWRQLCDGPILKPELARERKCIEAPTVLRRDGRLFMFYAGAYNLEPQQIGVAVSDDGLVWQRLCDQPFLPNGKPGDWNSSESGHPGVFQDGDRTWLFFQGNCDKGNTWLLSKTEVFWKAGKPSLTP
ncbi:MAG: glycoside hydrolase, partial [Phycisphaeraceae bacterium]|nr:glycoside hydrolase [Phycisphaeraceae bacterium]